MKLIVLKNNLKLGLDTIGRAIGSNLNLPILSNVLIKVATNQIRLSATNLELAITKIIPGKVIEEGSITIPHAVLANIVNNITSERIDLEVKNNNLSIKTDNYKASIQGVGESEFPIIPKIKEGKESVEIQSPAFKEALGKTIVAASISELRPEISGVLLITEPTVVKLVATDSFRLAEAKITDTQFKNNFERGFKVIIPLKTAQELLRITGDENVISIYTENNQVLFRTDGIEVISRLIDGNYPDYETIIPKNIDIELLVDRSELVNALRLVGSFTSKVNDVKIHVKDSKLVEIYSSDNALGENNYILPAKVSGTSIELSFNWKYLLDGVKSSGVSEKVFIGLNENNSPSMIKTPQDASYFYILMPIRQQ